MIQDFGQLRRVYGRNEAETILECSNTKIFFPGVNKEEAEYASELLGDMMVKTSNIHRGAHGASTNVSLSRRRLMTPDDIRRMQAGELLVVASNLAPMRLRAKPYFKVRRLRNLVKRPILALGANATMPQSGQSARPASTPGQLHGMPRIVQPMVQLIQRRPKGPGQVKP